MTHDVELLWFSDCPNHATARRMLEEVIAELVPGTQIRDLDATDPVVADRARFPGSPTIRVDGRDVDTSYVDPGDYTPRCRLYRTDSGLRGLPERRWIEDALRGVEPIPANNPDSDRSTPGSPLDDLGLLAAGTAALTAACCVTISLVLGVAVAPIGVGVGPRPLRAPERWPLGAGGNGRARPNDRRLRSRFRRSLANLGTHWRLTSGHSPASARAEARSR